MPFTPACPSCGGTDCEQVAEHEYACNDCEINFTHDGGSFQEEWDMEVEGDSLDMQAFEDRLNPCGDE